MIAPRTLAMVGLSTVLLSACSPNEATSGAGGTGPSRYAVAIQPSSIEVDTEGTVAFNAAMLGASNNLVTWRAESGTIDGAGNYTAPSAAGDYQVIATRLDTGARATGIARVRPRDKSTVPPAIQAFVATPATIDGGQTSTLAWTITGANSVDIQPGVGTVTGRSVVVSPTSTTTYSLTATNAAGATNATVIVAVTAPAASTSSPSSALAPSIGSFAASNTSITLGQATTLSWTTTGATAVSLDNGIGAMSTNGSYTVSPSVNTTYTLSATGAGGVTTQTVAITVSSSNATLMQQLAADMTGSAEALPHGVPSSWGFAQGPVPGMMNDPAAYQSQYGIVATAGDPWGQVYEAAAGNPATNSRVNIRNLRLFFKSKSTGTWSEPYELNGTSIAGNAYCEDFSCSNSAMVNRRAEPDGTFSVKVGNGYNYHFFPLGRFTFDPGDVGGWIAIFEARLILDDPNGVDDRSIAQLLASAGADYWPTASGNWPFGGAPAIADGKLKYVKPDWRWYEITSLSATDLTANPAPLLLTGISQ